ncbi:MAG TPA: site-specific integrase, partial [Candidatus Dormibacteraeota bacterium]|nr:site-specific integrase [Candidatus Dormibacteraeota bacterium]
MAHVEKRLRAGTLTWRARYRGPDGRELSRSFRRKVDADQFLTHTETEKTQGTWIDPARGEVHLGEWGERWLATTTHLKPKTVVGYDSLLRSRILPTFEQVPIGA